MPNPRAITLLSLAFLGLLPGALPASGSGMVVRAAFDPPTVTLGQQALYQVVIENGSGELQGSLPTVDGLRITPRAQTSQSSQMTMIQGQVSQTVTRTYSFPVQCEREGSFTVPAWRAMVGDSVITVPAATLSVVPPGEEWRDAYFLRLEPTPHTLYVGQTFSAQLQVGIRADVEGRLLNLPQKSGEAFTDPEISSEFSSGQATWKGLPYRVATWPIHLTPLRTGAHELSFTIPLALAQPRRAARDRHDFFSSVFERRQEQQHNASTGPLRIQVRELPEAGRPESFRGAIGRFSAAWTASSQSATVGEPITVLLKVSGEGNLSRLGPPPLAEDEQWRVYPPKTDLQLSTPTSGQVAFEYILIPRTTMVGALPLPAFSYFDPSAGVYHLSPAPDLPIEVKPAVEGQGAFVRSGLGRASVPPPLPPGLLPAQVLPGTPVKSLRPLFHDPFFLALQALPLSVLLGLAAWRRRSLRIGADPTYARQQRATRSLRSSLRAARQAANAQDQVAFHEAAVRALQEASIHRFPAGAEASSLTLGEIEQVLPPTPSGENPSETVATLRALFAGAEACRFAGAEVQTDLSVSAAMLERACQHLQRRPPEAPLRARRRTIPSRP